MGFSDSFTPPTSFRLMRLAQDAYDMPMMVLENTHESHPSLAHLCLLVFEAILEVVCVSLPGYIIARLGHFDADKQKFLANLNVMLFTPCLIFTKLASQLTAAELVNLAIIPVIFFVQTLVSWVVSIVVSKVFRLNNRASNFVTAMGVFGNSNSLPISLILSLSQTLKGLHWDQIPGDNDEEVGARGILYLLVFQQLGQLVRWSWGYHVLLAPRDRYSEYQAEIAEEGNHRYADEQQQGEVPALIEGLEGDTEDEDESHSVDSQNYEPAGRTPVAGASRVSLAESADGFVAKHGHAKNGKITSSSHQALNNYEDDILSFPRIRNVDATDSSEGTLRGFWTRSKQATKNMAVRTKTEATSLINRTYEACPRPVQITLSFLKTVFVKMNTFIWGFMNPPLWAMLMAILVACTPALQDLFFEDEGFVKNSVTSAIKSSGGVAVPLILVVLGANLARNTMAKEDGNTDPEEEVVGTRILVASLVSRMLLPTCIMAPILAIMAKYVPISILDDPIFVIVCFLLTGAPSALQLAQICQINGVYEKTMGRILFQSYVIWILPSTLILVMLALETVEWAR